MAIEKVETESDQDIFRSAMTEEPKEAVAEGGSGGSEEKPRDELGRFAPKQADDASVAAIEQQPEQVKEQPVVEPSKDEAQVPSWRLREQREELEARLARELEQAERRHKAQFEQWVQSQQPKQEPVDFFANPDAAIDQRVAPIESRFEQLASRLVLRASKAEAMATHGVASVQEMEQAIGKAMQEQHPDMPVLSMQMRNSDDPVGVAMSWYKRDKLLRDTGGDLGKYETALQEKLLKDPAFQAKAMEAWRAQASQPGNPSKVQIPPSLNRASGSAGNGADEGGDMSDASLWAASKPTGRRK